MISNFLLFLPTNPGLKAVMSYFSSTITLNAEGDTSISDETLEGLGNKPSSFLSLSNLLGVIIKLAEPPKQKRLPTSLPTINSPTTDFPPAESPNPDDTSLLEQSQEKYEEAKAAEVDGIFGDDYDEVLDDDEDTEAMNKKKSLLTQFAPDPGYFVAGAVAGVVSRTSTAPLDRLKVYLIANIGPTNDSITAATKGEPLTAVKSFGRPLIDACKDLWKAGGMRSLFAGMSRL